MFKFSLKLYIISFVLFIAIGCNNNHKLTMERGIQYYEWNMIEKAILEFKNVIHNLEKKSNNIDYSDIQLLSRAHHNLAVSYAKKDWLEEAVIEAKRAFELFPTEENKKVLDLIKNKLLKSTKKQL